jgi:uncharacterized protein (DUF2062 family)
MEILSAAFAIGLFFAFLSFIILVLKLALCMTIVYTAWKIFEIFVLKK